MKIILKYESGEKFEIECFDGKEVEVECHFCHTTIRATVVMEYCEICGWPLIVDKRCEQCGALEGDKK